MTHYRKLPASTPDVALAGFNIASAIHRPWRVFAATCAFAACSLSAPPASAAQTPKPSPATVKKNEVPLSLQAPVSLADQPPTPATVTFRNNRLTIQARNSSLLQILDAITAQTGMKVQGSLRDHRIFGTYGPAPSRQVLFHLLSGFHFNYLLVGTTHKGAPRKLVLAGTQDATPEPSQPVHAIQPAPPNTLPQPQFGPRPTYQHPSRQPPARKQMPANTPHKVLTPQQILKELESMRAHHKASSQ